MTLFSLPPTRPAVHHARELRLPRIPVPSVAAEYCQAPRVFKSAQDQSSQPVNPRILWHMLCEGSVGPEIFIGNRLDEIEATLQDLFRFDLVGPLSEEPLAFA